MKIRRYGMIEFDRNYFQGEIRSGYYVDSERKRLWAANLEVLMEIDRICKKHSITLFPWIFIMMKRGISHIPEL